MNYPNLPSAAGQKLRARREWLHLRYRDVEEASRTIAERRADAQYHVGISRLADIEHKGTLPSFYRLYALAAIYHLDFCTALAWYGIDLQAFPLDSALIPHEITIRLNAEAFPVQPPSTRSISPSEEYSEKTFFLTRQLRNWGKLPADLLLGLDTKRFGYAFIGTADWFMYPLLRPGSFIQIDETLKKVPKDGWTVTAERPIFLVEHRDGYRCGWCSMEDRRLIVQPHPSSGLSPEFYQCPEEASIVGQIVGLAMRLDPVMRRHKHFATDLE